ncbi:MAG: hypothetical protein AAF647_02145 [Pseudomonadota bacterium]
MRRRLQEDVAQIIDGQHATHVTIEMTREEARRLIALLDAGMRFADVERAPVARVSGRIEEREAR